MAHSGIGTFRVSTPSDREIVLTRVFDAPRALVFEAYTKPKLMKRWFGPRGWSLVVCEVDMKVGGTFRIVWRGPDGAEMGMRGTYREIVPPERLVHTELFDDFGDWTGDETLATTVLTERDGKTTLTTTMLYPSQQVRNRVFKSGMSRGVSECYDKLDELLASIA